MSTGQLRSGSGGFYNCMYACVTGCIRTIWPKMKCLILSCLGILCVWLYMKRKSEKYFSNRSTFRGPTVPLNLVVYLTNGQFAQRMTTLHALSTEYRKQRTALENIT